AEYQSAKLEQERVESRLKEIDHILKNVEVIKHPSKSDIVRLGSTVELKEGSKKVSFSVVGTVEADPLEGKVSDESPVGQALLGKAVGDKVEIETPAQTRKYTVAAIS
ncbi:MAG: GreA/GreB family elongation factor, partial [Patescibacteria group bacterium]